MCLMVSSKVEDNSVNFHFILFVNVDGHLYELGKALTTVELDWTYFMLYSSVKFDIVKVLTGALKTNA